MSDSISFRQFRFDPIGSYGNPPTRHALAPMQRNYTYRKHKNYTENEWLFFGGGGGGEEGISAGNSDLNTTLLRCSRTKLESM